MPSSPACWTVASVCSTSGPIAESCGPGGSMPPRSHSPRTSETTGGWWSAAGGVVGDHDHAFPARRSGRGSPSRRPPAPGARRSSARWRGHRHHPRHRGQTARRCIRGICGSSGLASYAARLAGNAHPRSHRTGCCDHPQRHVRWLDFSYSGYELDAAARHPYDEGVWLGDIGTAVAARGC
jgi:hypothetical protein